MQVSRFSSAKSDVSAQTRRNRVAAGRKAAWAAAMKRIRQAEAAAARDGDPSTELRTELGPDGPHRGSAPIDWDFAGVLARVRRAAIARGELKLAPVPDGEGGR